MRRRHFPYVVGVVSFLIFLCTSVAIFDSHEVRGRRTVLAPPNKRKSNFSTTKKSGPEAQSMTLDLFCCFVVVVVVLFFSSMIVGSFGGFLAFEELKSKKMAGSLFVFFRRLPSFERPLPSFGRISIRFGFDLRRTGSFVEFDKD